MTGEKVPIDPVIIAHGRKEAVKHGHRMRDRGDNPRSVQEKEECFFRGFISEAHHNLMNEDIMAWVEHYKAANTRSDDGGTDVPGKSINVKVIRPGDRVIAANDRRAQTYVVYEYDESDQTLRHLGTFERADIHEIEFPFRCKGVMRDELK